jgi:hypothetical protein
MSTLTQHQNLGMNEDRGIKDILGDLYRNSKTVAQQEVILIKEETKAVGEKTKTHGVLIASFGALAVLSVFPFMAFMILGLGRLMDDNYWLSSLIVAVLFAAVGGGVALASWKKMKADLKFPRTKSTFRRIVDFLEMETTKLKKEEVFSNGTTTHQRI